MIIISSQANIYITQSHCAPSICFDHLHSEDSNFDKLCFHSNQFFNSVIHSEQLLLTVASYVMSNRWQRLNVNLFCFVLIIWYLLLCLTPGLVQNIKTQKHNRAQTWTLDGNRFVLNENKVCAWENKTNWTQS